MFGAGEGASAPQCGMSSPDRVRRPGKMRGIILDPPGNPVIYFKVGAY